MFYAQWNNMVISGWAVTEQQIDRWCEQKLKWMILFVVILWFTFSYQVGGYNNVSCNSLLYICSGMIACACGMSEWSVECECVCRWMDEWMVSGWNECDCVARAPCNTGWKLNCSQLLGSIYVCERPQRERDKREKTGIKSVHFGRLLSTSLKPTTLHI